MTIAAEQDSQCWMCASTKRVPGRTAQLNASEQLPERLLLNCECIDKLHRNPLPQQEIARATPNSASNTAA